MVKERYEKNSLYLDADFEVFLKGFGGLIKFSCFTLYSIIVFYLIWEIACSMKSIMNLDLVHYFFL